MAPIVRSKYSYTTQYSKVMSELQGLVAAVPPGREARFSLYSTDTEEQMASVNKGLDRCATLLKCLLSPDRPQREEEGKTHQNVAAGVKRKPNDRHGNKGIKASSKQSKKDPSVEPSFPGAWRHHHHHPPHASSTPIKRHVRALTGEPRPLQAPPHDTSEPTRRQVRAHRRIKSTTTSSRRKTGKENQPTDNTHRPSSADGCRPGSADDAVLADRLSRNQTLHPSLWPLPPPPPAPYHPSYYYPPVCSCYYPYWQARQPYTIHPSTPAGEGTHGDPLHSRSLPSFKRPAPVSDGETSNGSKRTSLHVIEALMQDVLLAVEDCLVKTRLLSGEGSAQAKQLMDGLSRSLAHYCHLVQVQCQHLVNAGLKRPSVMELINQIQQLEMEKSQLLERVLKSDAGYTESRREVEQASKKYKVIQNELRESRSQNGALKKALRVTEEELNQVKEQLKTAEEDTERTRHTVDQLNTKSSLLQDQVDSLREQLLKHNKGNHPDHDQLSKMMCSLEAAQDEVEMMKVSLSEKEEQLLQSQDKLLGLRQCLAYFLTELTKMKPRDDSSPLVGYCVSGEAVQKMHSLVSDGNIDGFLASYSHQTNPSPPVPSSPSLAADDNDSTLTLTQTKPHPSPSKTTPTTNDIISPLQSSMATQSDHLSHHHHHHHHHPTSSYPIPHHPGDQATSHQLFPLPVKNPLSSSLSTVTGASGMTTSSELEFRRDLATLDDDIARLQMQFRIAMQVDPRLNQQ